MKHDDRTQLIAAYNTDGHVAESTFLLSLKNVEVLVSPAFFRAGIMNELTWA